MKKYIPAKVSLAAIAAFAATAASAQTAATSQSSTTTSPASSTPAQASDQRAQGSVAESAGAVDGSGRTPGTAGAPPAASGVNAGDIIVTANKREQSLNNVGATIQAASGLELAQRGIGNVADLGKLVPGFTFTQSLYSTPVYTLRGIGLYDATFGAAPSVSVYTDQIPRNVPVMSDALDLDIERVEVLKGPQGTLFGQSSTGGAINYIVGKPTQEFHTGLNFSYERFDRAEVSGFISGPITDGIKARLAIKATGGGAWQHSLSRPDDVNGATREYEGRFTVDLQPVNALTIELMATGVRDQSDPLAPQYAGTLLDLYPTQAAAAASGNPYARVDAQRYADLTTPTSPGYDASFLGRQKVEITRLNGTDPTKAAGARALLGTTISTNPQDAEWTPGLLRKSDNSYYQFAGHADLRLTDVFKLTYIAAFAKKKLAYNQDLDGTVASIVDVPLSGNVRSFNNELRLAADSGSFHGLIGASYDNLRTVQNNLFLLNAYSANADLITTTFNAFTSRMRSYGLFANAEIKVASRLTAQGGIRYTNNKQNASYCYSDPASDTGQGTATLFGAALNSKPITILPGQCFPTTGDLLLGTAQSTLTPVNQSLNEHNVSYRVGLNYKFDQGTLLYATVSQGYKAGIFSAIGASRVNQYTPATQEKVIAYEAGFKAPILGSALQFNGAGFYYDYSNKQVRGRVQDAVFGLLEKLLNVPKSYVWGLEGELVARPFDGLRLSGGATYLQSKVTSDYSATPDGLAVYNAAGYTGNFRGSELPYTPKFSGNVDAQYSFPLSAGVSAFVGGDVTYQSRQNTTFHNASLPANDFYINGYALVDLRAGFNSPNNRWRVSAFGRNVTNKSYVTAVSTYLDTLIRYRGKPAVYGLSLSVNY